jgi:hypothetical protein
MSYSSVEDTVLPKDPLNLLGLWSKLDGKSELTVWLPYRCLLPQLGPAPAKMGESLAALPCGYLSNRR